MMKNQKDEIKNIDYGMCASFEYEDDMENAGGPKISDEEFYICASHGAFFASRDTADNVVRLWKTRPQPVCDCEGVSFASPALVATYPAMVFPSVTAGTVIEAFDL